MPELPEVQTIVNDLRLELINKTIKDCLVLDKKLVHPLTPTVWQKKIIGKKIKAIDRLAKIIIFDLGGFYLAIHLKMTGQLILRTNKKTIVGGHPINQDKILPNKFTRTHFLFTSGARLFFNDVRKFGWLKLISKSELAEIANRHGVNPLTKEFTLKKFVDILAKRPRAKIKQLLLDQKLLAGLGNIYSDESLFKAGIKPWRVSGALSIVESKKLHQAIKTILKKAVAYRGTSFSDYVDAKGKQGNFLSQLMVYGRAGELCKKCEQAKVSKMKLGGRGTHWCESCQS